MTLERLVVALGLRLRLQLEPASTGNTAPQELRREFLAAVNRKRLAASLLELEAEVDLGGREADELGGREADELEIFPDEAGLGVGGNWVSQTAHGRLDVMQEVPGVRSWDQLRAGAVACAGVLYARYDDLVSMKSAGRERDLADIAALRAARGEP